LPDITHPGQHCGVLGRNIFDAVGGTRDVIAYAEFTRTQLCLLSLDFSSAFDQISHAYFFRIFGMHEYNDQATGLIGHYISTKRQKYRSMGVVPDLSQFSVL
jgi:hypothetical protein